MSITLHVPIGVNRFLANFLMYDSVDPHFFYCIVLSSIQLQQWAVSNKHGEQEFSLLKATIFLPKIFNIFFYLQSGLLQNEKVRDVHSSVTPCQHCPRHLAQSVKKTTKKQKRKTVQMLAKTQMQICTEGFSIHTATLFDAQSLWLLRLLFYVTYVVFIATVPSTWLP